ncbi:DUF5131 family protein [Streptomyces sp. NPDC087659]|uniref:DUF5131 family protein n=1 Tax=Streptomyces sp. NPDC087659 TaxID=3365801 RepID=UPI00380050E3
MSTDTSIEWTDTTWSPVTGCDRISPGCDNCYALTMARRLKAMGQPRYQRDGNPRTSGPGFGVSIHPDAVNEPLSWRKPRRVFVNSMADLFHQDVDQAWIADVFAVMAAATGHTFQVLTKRHARMRHILNDPAWVGQVRARAIGKGLPADAWWWPISNVWLGVSVETQQWADLRIPALLATPAAVRFLSCEPLLGPVDLKHSVISMGSERGHGLTASFVHAGGCCEQQLHGINWVIVGGESGAKARPMHPDWARSLRDQCAAASIPFFFKQWGAYLPVPVVDDPAFAGGRAYDNPLGGRSSATIRERGPSRTFRSGPTRAMEPGDRSRRTWLLDADTIAVRVGKKAAGRELDGRTHDDYPTPVRSA